MFLKLAGSMSFENELWILWNYHVLRNARTKNVSTHKSRDQDQTNHHTYFRVSGK